MSKNSSCPFAPGAFVFAYLRHSPGDNQTITSQDSPESAASELANFFGDSAEVCTWTPVSTPWIYNVAEELA